MITSGKISFYPHMETGRRAVHFAEDLLFPRHCSVCDQPVRPFGALVCPECERSLHPLTSSSGAQPLCMKCGKPLEDPLAEYCYDCGRTVHVYRRGCAVFRYREVSGAIYRFKYEGRAEYADYFGRKMAERFREEFCPERVEALVPVPLSPERYRKRGYNQAALLARGIGRECGVPVCEGLLRRTRSTEAMRGKSRADRIRNLKNAFIADLSDVKSSMYVLVDDIYTTGSTVDACAGELMRAGAAGVYFITLAIGESHL